MRRRFPRSLHVSVGDQVSDERCRLGDNDQRRGALPNNDHVETRLRVSNELMTTSPRRFLTTHAGSLVRPIELVESMISRELGEPIDDREYEETLRVAVQTVVTQQVQVGIDIISDGEFGKT